MRRTKLRWLVAGLLVPLIFTFAVAWPVYSQNSSLMQVLSGNNVPTTIKASELTKDYRVVKAGENMEVTVMQMQMLGMGGRTAMGGVYYTKGETLKIGDITYMIGYRAAEDARELQRRIQNHENVDNPFEVRRLEASEVLTLSLLNLRTAGSLNDVRPFDPEREVMSDAEAKALRINRANAESTQNLRQLALGVLQYVQDYDESYPPMVQATSFNQIEQGVRPNSNVTRSTPVQVRIGPYVRNNNLFRHPVTKEIYRFNQSLSYKNQSAIDNLSTIAMIYEGSAAPDGTRAVAFADGSARRVRETEWPAIKKRSGIGTATKPLSKPVPPTKGERLRQTNRASEKNLRQIGLALKQYLSDWDESLPPMQPATSIKQIEQGLKSNVITPQTPVHVRIQPYVRSTKIFQHPVTKEIYQPNQNLSLRNESSIERIDEAVLFYEASPAPDGTRAIVYADGHVSRVKESDWVRIRKAAGIAAPKPTKASRTRRTRRGRDRAGPNLKRSRTRRASQRRT